MAKELNTQRIDTRFYIAQDESGNLQCYDQDPLRASDRESSRIDILKVIVDSFGRPDVCNPIVFMVKGALLQRCQPFNAGIPERIRAGAALHLEDFDGTRVEIVSLHSSNPEFPFTGVLFDEKGDGLGFRLYSRDGGCEDGKENHRLVVIDGLMPEKEGQE